jgi:hypothetical protein
MNSSIAAVTLCTGVGSGLPSVIQTASHRLRPALLCRVCAVRRVCAEGRVAAVVLPAKCGTVRRVKIRHRGGSPSVAPDAYIAPTAVISGRVRVGPGSCVLHGAVLTVVRAGLDEAGGFMPFVFGADPAVGRGQQMRTAMRRYASSLARSHGDDEHIQQPQRP